MAKALAADVVVVGGGPAGLSAATELAKQARVVVLEREAEAGGIPRHSHHTGFGLRDLHRSLPGPKYAQRLVRMAEAAGVEILTESMVTGWESQGTCVVTSPIGRLAVSGQAVVLATGARERPRSARLIAGDRPAGVFTTGQLQNYVHRGLPVGSRAVVVGSELVSWSAVLTLAAAGCHTELMLTSQARPEAYPGVAALGRLRYGVELLTNTKISAIVGGERVSAVQLLVGPNQSPRTVACDTVVLTGDWVPDHELARTAGVRLDQGSKGPLVDRSLRTNQPGLFAIGNLVHPVETADVAALSGRHVAQQVRRFLDAEPGSLGPDSTRRLDASAGQTLPDGVRVLAEPPLTWVSPGLLRPDDAPPARARMLAWSDRLVRMPVVEVSQAGRVLSRRRLPWSAAPGRMFRVPSAMFDRVDYGLGEVTLRLR